MYVKEFDTWNVLKQELNTAPIKPFFHEREVWWRSIGVNIGVEIDGKNFNKERPVLILRKFNRLMVWVVPLTSKEKSGPYFQKVVHPKGKSWVILHQLRLVSSKRLLRKIGMISMKDFKIVKNGIIHLIKNIELPS